MIHINFGNFNGIISVIFHKNLCVVVLIVSKLLVRKRFNGITLWPFIIACKKQLKEDLIFVNHEKIHLRQQAEMLVIPFYLWYSIEFVFRLFQYKNKHDAYKNISFEREAYANQKNFSYLNERSFWAFLTFL